MLLRVSRRSMERLLNSCRARGIKVGREWRLLGGDLLRLPVSDDLSDEELSYGLAKLSEPAFARIWDNDEDAVYDSL